MIALEILLLFTPAVIFKLYRDRNGRKHPDVDGVLKVAFVMILCVSAVRFIQICRHGAPFVMTPETILWWYLKAFLVAVTGYGLFFNPLMNFVLMYKQIKRAGQNLFPMSSEDFVIVFDRLSPTAWPDRWFIKFRIGWKTRLIGYVALFVCSILWFVI